MKSNVRDCVSEHQKKTMLVPTIHDIRNESLYLIWWIYKTKKQENFKQIIGYRVQSSLSVFLKTA